MCNSLMMKSTVLLLRRIVVWNYHTTRMHDKTKDIQQHRQTLKIHRIQHVRIRSITVHNMYDYINPLSDNDVATKNKTSLEGYRKRCQENPTRFRSAPDDQNQKSMCLRVCVRYPYSSHCLRLHKGILSFFCYVNYFTDIHRCNALGTHDILHHTILIVVTDTLNDTYESMFLIVAPIERESRY